MVPHLRGCLDYEQSLSSGLQGCAAKAPIMSFSASSSTRYLELAFENATVEPAQPLRKIAIGLLPNYRV